MKMNPCRLRRADGRTLTRIRPVKIVRGVVRHAAGSAWIRIGNTQVVCAATVDERIPPWLRGRGKGWVTAEYGMLPCSVPERAARGRVSGRSFEIQRLIGRSPARRRRSDARSASGRS